MFKIYTFQLPKLKATTFGMITKDSQAKRQHSTSGLGTTAEPRNAKLMQPNNLQPLDLHLDRPGPDHKYTQTPPILTVVGLIQGFQGSNFSHSQ